MTALKKQNKQFQNVNLPPPNRKKILTHSDLYASYAQRVLVDGNQVLVQQQVA